MKKSTINNIKPELTAPAGDWPSLVTAVENGADSVYFGVKGLNMRDQAENFDIFELPKIMRFLRQHRKKGYLALNVMVMDSELVKAGKILDQAKAAEVDAVIVWDMAVFAMAKERGLRIHVSTQASVANTRALAWFAQAGAQRIVLARECSLADISRIVKAIRAENIRCEVEVFVHGAMCISLSGRCFLSSYSAGKSANRGECLQYCRREFSIKDTSGEADYVLGNNYILSAPDLCSVEFIDKLIESGAAAFKIEGRRRAPEYVKVTVSVYRRGIDAYYAGRLTRRLKTGLRKELGTVFNRGFSSGFYLGKPASERSRGIAADHEKRYLGCVEKFYKQISVAEVELHNDALVLGQTLLVSGKKTAAFFVTVEEMQQDHASVTQAQKGERVAIKVPAIVRPKDKVFLWVKKTSQTTPDQDAG